MNGSPLARPFPALPGPTLKTFVREAFDFALVLDADGRILEILEPSGGRALPLSTLQGELLLSRISVESRSKVSELLSSDCLSPSPNYRWRHVNLMLDEQRSWPVLAKLANFGDEQQPLRVLIARDLSPIRELQQRFVQVYSDLDRLRHQLDAARADRERSAEAVRWVGTKPLDRIIEETVGYLERSCIVTALGRTQGDHRAAALLLGLSLEDFSERFEALGRD